MYIIDMYIESVATRDWNEAPTAGYLVWHLSLKWRVALDRALAPLGLTHARYALLASLYGLSRQGEQPSQRELADVSGLEPMYVSKLSRVLERNRLIERTEHSTDPRALQLALTERGGEVVTRAIAIVRDLHDRLLAPLGGRSGRRSAELMDTLRELLRHAETLPDLASAGSPVDPAAETPH